MTSKNNNNDDNMQNIKHCVLIDGNFGRHGLFSNIHPYTLDRVDKLNDDFTLKRCAKEARKMFNNASNIHYHICYNSFSEKIDEYYKKLKLIYPQSVLLHPLIDTIVEKNDDDETTLKLIANNCNYKFNYIWIIHGIENHYENLIERIKSNNDSSKINIFKYSWIENLQDGSDYIEYLINYKIKNLLQDQNEKLNDQTVLSNSMAITIESQERKNKRKKRLICNINGCKKKCKNENILKDHQTIKHPNIQSIIPKETMTMKSISTIKESDINTCKPSFHEPHILHIHEIDTQPIRLRCPFSKECLDSNTAYSGIFNLQNHVMSQHAQSFSRRICPILECQNKNPWQDWSSLLEHILQMHTIYLLNDSISNILKQQPTISEVNTSRINQEKPMTNIPSCTLDKPFKCLYNGCDRSYRYKLALKRHEAFAHPVPLQCPFSSECQQSSEKYIGLWNLRKHVFLKHVPLFSEPMCFDFTCKYEENNSFETWNHVLRHILLNHLDANGIIITSPRAKHTSSNRCFCKRCNQSFKTEEEFHYHLTTSHLFPLQCPYNSTCNEVFNDGEPYFGLIELENHIIRDHSTEFCMPRCFNRQCDKENNFQDWKIFMTHIIEKHWRNIELG